MSLSTLLFTEYQRRVLALLLLHPEASYHVREIARLTHTTAGTLHRELSKLAKAQVLTRVTSGNQVYYQANRDCFIYEELASILRKTSGVVDVLSDALVLVAKNITVAFVFGSLAKGTEHEGSDIDVLIIGEVDYGDVVSALYPAQTLLRREINPKVFTENEWESRSEKNDPFIKNILSKPKLFIIGDENDIK